jgi:hypothetical protein
MMFDETYGVRPDEDDEATRSNVIDLHTRATQSSTDLAINANRGGVWWFDRKGDSYVGLFSAKPNARLETTGRWALREIRREDRVNVFICQVGSADRFGSFNDFMKACCRARIYVALGVYKPSLPLVDIDCSYDIPGKKNLWLRLEKRWPIYDGTPLRDEDFPRWENPWISVPWRKRDYTLSHNTAGRPPVEPFHDCVTGARTGTGL